MRYKLTQEEENNFGFTFTTKYYSDNDDRVLISLHLAQKPIGK